MLSMLSINDDSIVKKLEIEVILSIFIYIIDENID